MEEFDDLLWMLVHRHINNNNLDFELNRTEEDLFSIAREAAVVAFAKYQHDKGMKLTTWIAQNVKQALGASKRYEFSKLVQDEELEESSASYTPDELEFNIAMKQMLPEKLYQVYHHRFVEDMSEREIAEAMGITKAKVRICLSRILARYELIEMSRTKVLTTRRLQDNWLNSSDQ